ncbi:serine proteinase stubble-like [Physella acuta]|uniref:serine proteinase stubble-like n=1 Tax=Physella acuta TaxID=109671 RepID=UPI0027DD86E4|nr:serine proteinase stubble-like [Physella acuta]XP_059145906.1 serine proteinase stubble-like [Physella acuta]
MNTSVLVLFALTLLVGYLQAVDAVTPAAGTSSATDNTPSTTTTTPSTTTTPTTTTNSTSSTTNTSSNTTSHEVTTKNGGNAKPANTYMLQLTGLVLFTNVYRYLP